MKKLLLILAALGIGILPASAQNYNFNIGGLQYASGPSVPAACSRPGSWFYKNTSTKGWYICNGSTYDAMSTGGSSGTVTSVIGTVNQITSDGNTATPTLSIPSTFIGPGSVTATTTLGAKGATSGTATITAPAIAGTSTNPFALSNVLNTPDGAVATVSYGFTSSPGTGLYLTAGPTATIAAGGAFQVLISQTLAQFVEPICPSTSGDTCISRVGAKILGVGTGTNGSTAGFIKTAQTLQITGADVTCGTGGTISSCVAMQAVTGLSVALPLVAANWSFDCNLIVGQATAAAANQIGVQTATNGATNLAASAVANTAAAVSTAASITGVASTTTAQSVVTFTPGATGTKMPIHLWGTIEGASASGTTFNVTALTGAAADLLTIYRGSTCQVY